METARRLLLSILFVALGLVSCAAKEGEEATAKVRVKGLGLLESRRMQLAIGRLWGDQLGPTMNTNQIEDAALFIASTLGPRGYQAPRIRVEARERDEAVRRFEVDLKLEGDPPPWLEAREVTFHVEEGVRYHIENVTIEGLTTLSTQAGRDFFFSDVALIRGKAARAYSPQRLKGAASALESTLRHQGFAESEVRIADTRINTETGQVDAVVRVKEGPRWQVAQVRLHVSGPRVPGLERIEQHQGGPWSTFRSQDIAQEIRQAYYKSGYPDVRVRMEANARPAEAGIRLVDVTSRIEAGEQVRVGDVRFRGQDRTKEAVLRRRVDMDSGELLNPLELERARYRLGRLGVFRSVDLSYEPPDGPVRSPLFTVEEEKAIELNLMGGYGSYDRLRGGIEVIHRNVFGRAHQSRVVLVQSMKSSRLDYTYTVPEIFGESVDGSVRLFGLQREERAFLRQEYGATVTLKRRFSGIGADGSVGYTYQSLRNDRNELYTRVSDGRQLEVASIDIGLTRDNRDNPLRPRRGYRWYVQSELASRALGGEVNYQRLETGGSYHTSWGRGRWVHVGLSHGVVTTFGSTDVLLPVNKRFYPGGESSIRGYGEGEAAPRAPDGRYIGAKSYLLLDTEVEQALTRQWSLVVFADFLGVAEKIRSYPFDTELVSVGLGVRYQTLIGPIRLEYGHNVLKRDVDPDGALLFSIGFPF